MAHRFVVESSTEQHKIDSPAVGTTKFELRNREAGPDEHLEIRLTDYRRMVASQEFSAILERLESANSSETVPFPT